MTKVSPDVLLENIGGRAHLGPKITSITRRYYFTHTNKKDQASGARGNPGKKAELFLHTCRTVGHKGNFTFIDKSCTIVEITEYLTEDP